MTLRCLPTTQGWLYLAVVLDLCARKVIGWATSTRIDTELDRTALPTALARSGTPRGVGIHTDLRQRLLSLAAPEPGLWLRTGCQHQRPRRLLRQCGGGELLPQPEGREHPWCAANAPLCLREVLFETRRSRVHPNPSPFPPRIHQPRCIQGSDYGILWLSFALLDISLCKIIRASYL